MTPSLVLIDSDAYADPGMGVRVHRRDHFALPIIRIPRVPDFERRQQGLVDLALALRREEPGVVCSDVGAYQSPHDLHRREDPRVRWVVNQVERALASIPVLGSVPADMSRAPGSWAGFEIDSMWVDVHESGGYTAPHTHERHDWSGVFHVLAEATRIGASDDDADGMICFVNPNSNSVPYGARARVQLAPADGTMVLFPGMLLRTVLPHQNGRLRVAIGFDANLAARR